MNIVYSNTIDVTDYSNLRASAGWHMLPQRQAQKGINRSDYLVSAFDGKKAVGMARVLTDGGCVALLLDVVVLPEYQGMGIGKTMIQMSMTYIKSTLKNGEIAYVCLMAAPGKEEFYKKFGFEARPNDYQGAGMTQWVRKVD